MDETTIGSPDIYYIGINPLGIGSYYVFFEDLIMEPCPLLLRITLKQFFETYPVERIDFGGSWVQPINKYNGIRASIQVIDPANNKLCNPVLIVRYTYSGGETVTLHHLH